jgi:hypothetical protein
MEWNIIFDPEFRKWFYEQETEFQDEAFAVLTILREQGASLGRPRVDTIQGSVFKNLKEQRIRG